MPTRLKNKNQRKILKLLLKKCVLITLLVSMDTDILNTILDML